MLSWCQCSWHTWGSPTDARRGVPVPAGPPGASHIAQRQGARQQAGLPGLQQACEPAGPLIDIVHGQCNSPGASCIVAQKQASRRQALLLGCSSLQQAFEQAKPLIDIVNSPCNSPGASCIVAQQQTSRRQALRLCLCCSQRHLFTRAQVCLWRQLCHSTDKLAQGRRAHCLRDRQGTTPGRLTWSLVHRRTAAGFLAASAAAAPLLLAAWSPCETCLAQPVRAALLQQPLLPRLWASCPACRHA